jgi:alkyl sulfatase BDS1-like metallo-beta-lactamase superfamily hydrolase
MSDEVKENKVKQGRPARQLSITDICGLIRYYKNMSYDVKNPKNYDESPLFDYIKGHSGCSSIMNSQAEAEKRIKYYDDNPSHYEGIDLENSKKRVLDNVLNDEDIIESIRKIVSEFDDDTWARILSRKRQAEYRSKNSKKKISINVDTFYDLKHIKERKFNNASWDEVFAKFIKASETIDNLNEGFIDDINSNEDTLKLLNSLFD